MLQMLACVSCTLTSANFQSIAVLQTESLLSLQHLPMLRHVLVKFHEYICSTYYPAVQVRITIISNVIDTTQFMLRITDQKIACSLFSAAAQWQLVSAIAKVHAGNTMTDNIPQQWSEK